MRVGSFACVFIFPEFSRKEDTFIFLLFLLFNSEDVNTKFNSFSFTTINRHFFPLSLTCHLTYFKDSIEKLVYKFELITIVQIVEVMRMEFFEAP